VGPVSHLDTQLLIQVFVLVVFRALQGQLEGEAILGDLIPSLCTEFDHMRDVEVWDHLGPLEILL
jgi:hypothetical protein